MAHIKIFRPDTYSKDIRNIRRRLIACSKSIIFDLQQAEFIVDYICKAIWKQDNPLKYIHQRLISALEEHDIITYHCTRLLDSDSIFTNGLLRKNTSYIKHLSHSMQQNNISSILRKEVLDAVQKEIAYQSRRDRENRNKNHFFYDMDYYLEYGKF